MISGKNVAVLDFTKHEIILGNDETIPVITWLDQQGVPCRSDNASYCIAGAIDTELYAIDIEMFVDEILN